MSTLREQIQRCVENVIDLEGLLQEDREKQGQAVRQVLSREQDRDREVSRLLLLLDRYFVENPEQS
jgi:hypothetical protein